VAESSPLRWQFDESEASLDVGSYQPASSSTTVPTNQPHSLPDRINLQQSQPTNGTRTKDTHAPHVNRVHASQPMSAWYNAKLKGGHWRGKCGLPEVVETSRALKQKAQRLASLLRSSERVVVHTGAGLSTAAGLPDFRGSAGVWTLEKQGRSVSSSLAYVCLSVQSVSWSALSLRLGCASVCTSVCAPVCACVSGCLRVAVCLCKCQVMCVSSGRKSCVCLAVVVVAVVASS
jgi:hypothetical protein